MKRAELAAGLVLLATLQPVPLHAFESRNVRLLTHLDPYAVNSSCWGYVHHDGREYAIVGTLGGTSIVNVSRPDAPYEVMFVPGVSSEWREAKQYRQWVYVSTEGRGGGIQILRMSDPEHPVLVRTFTTLFDALHTIQIDTTRALLYANGASLGGAQQGMFILSLEDPENPSLRAPYWYDADHYVHDGHVRGDRYYFAGGNGGWLRVLDVSDPYGPREERAWSYPGYSFTHSIELSRDGRYAYVCDEASRQPLRIFDLAAPGDPPLASLFDSPPGQFLHQWHVKQDTAVVAAYMGGARLYDLTFPTHPAEFAYLDTYDAVGSGFVGAWEVFSFPSGICIASDIQSGLFVFQPVPDYGVVRVLARDESGAPLGGIRVRRSGDQDGYLTDENGIAVLAADPGVFDLAIEGTGLETITVRLALRRGAHEEIAVELRAPGAAFALDPPAPNPARAAVRVSLSLPGTIAVPVRVTLHDARGRRVAVLYDESAPPGRLLATWNGRDARGSRVPSGVYWVTAESGGWSASKRVVWIR